MDEPRNPRDHEGSIFDFLDALDDVDPYDEEEPFVPFFRREWVKVVAALVAIAMLLAVGFSGLQVIFHWRW